MEDLLSYYEHELSFLRRFSGEFAERYPKIAGRLAPTGVQGDDPHIAQMISAVALLDARIAKKIDDDFTQGVEALFEVLHPHYLRPFPACSIAQLRFDAETVGPRTYNIARGTELHSRSINGVPCRFRTVYDVTLAPLAISEARYVPAAEAPIVLPVDAAGIVSLTVETTAAGEGLGSFGLRTVRVHLDGESSFVAALADGLFVHAATSYVETDGDGRWKPLRTLPIAPAGFDESDALLDYALRSHPAYRPLTEYFGFPEKFDFADIELGAMLDMAGACRRVTLHVVLKESRANANAARLLETLSTAHFKLFSTPVVNLFEQRGEPVRVTHQQVAYPVVADARCASGYDVYSIDSVSLVRQGQAYDEVTEVRPLFSRHYVDERQPARYWIARRDEAVAALSPGYETEISVIDAGFDAMAAYTDTLSIELTCTNRDLPARLAVGLEGGDLFMARSAEPPGPLVVTMLRRPTQARRFERRDALPLRLASHLALDELSLADLSLSALKAALVLYDVRRSAVSLRHIDGIAAVQSRATEIELPGNPFTTKVEGIEVRLTIDESHFVGASIAGFVGAINTFLGYCVQMNSFVQLIVESKNTGEEVMRCKPRSSERVLAGVGV
jgi:type VI secretion system protein ImpG